MAEKETSKDRKEKRAAELVRLKQQWLDEGQPPYSSFFNQIKSTQGTPIALETFKKHLISGGYLAGDEPKSAAPQAPASGTSGLRADLQQRFLESLPDDAIKNWLYAEVDRLTARVKELEEQLDAANPDR